MSGSFELGRRRLGHKSTLGDRTTTTILAACNTPTHDAESAPLGHASDAVDALETPSLVFNFSLCSTRPCRRACFPNHRFRVRHFLRPPKAVNPFGSPRSLIRDNINTSRVRTFSAVAQPSLDSRRATINRFQKVFGRNPGRTPRVDPQPVGTVSQLGTVSQGYRLSCRVP